MFSSFSTPTIVPLRSTWCMNFHPGMDQNQTVGMTCVKLRCKYYKLLAPILHLKGLWETSRRSPHCDVKCSQFLAQTVFSRLFYLICLMNSYSCFTAQLKNLLFQDNFYNHPGKRKHFLSGFPPHSVHVPFIPAPPITNCPHRQVGIKSVPTS